MRMPPTDAGWLRAPASEGLRRARRPGFAYRYAMYRGREEARADFLAAVLGRGEAIPATQATAVSLALSGFEARRAVPLPATPPDPPEELAAGHGTVRAHVRTGRRPTPLCKTHPLTSATLSTMRFAAALRGRWRGGLGGRWSALGRGPAACRSWTVPRRPAALRQRSRGASRGGARRRARRASGRGAKDAASRSGGCRARAPRSPKDFRPACRGREARRRPSGPSARPRRRSWRRRARARPPPGPGTLPRPSHADRRRFRVQGRLRTSMPWTKTYDDVFC